MDDLRRRMAGELEAGEVVADADDADDLLVGVLRDELARDVGVGVEGVGEFFAESVGKETRPLDLRGVCD